ncbi:hypothetical protein AOA59_27910 [Pseudomonas sp. 2822-15]|uniref:DUF2971 domain-containing protein n=1 Tax=Pseudomonas sp. 2822-15 TaxID=1712677 RepID=UPI000C14C7D5|nr:DUF2971 domain-containing protein [Pseudomonas sp. 2822-15]PIB40328.1 hypothetical protein AOA59_27910 [Pseudomonas sp. 2822-15]
MDIHHYTRASTLPLILQGGKLRFTRADCLDDLAELPFEAFHLTRQAYFINSWVKSPVETSGQWYRYADQHRGVRLSFNGSPFPRTKLRLELKRPYTSLNGKPETLGFRLNRAPAPFMKETMFGKGYVLMPWADEESFGGDVLYVEDPVAYVKQFINSIPEMTEVTGGSRLARTKAKHWEDQSEYRFTLMAVKGPDLIYTDDPDHYENELLNMMEQWQSLGNMAPPPEVTFIDLPVDALMLQRMTVTLGSRISIEDRNSVLQSIQCYAPNATVLESSIQAR